MLKKLVFPALLGGCLIAPAICSAQDGTPTLAEPARSSGVTISEGGAPAIPGEGIDTPTPATPTPATPAPATGAPVAPAESATPSLVDDITPLQAPAALPSTGDAAPVESHQGHAHQGHVHQGEVHGDVHHGGGPAACATGQCGVGHLGALGPRAAELQRKIAIAANPNGWWPPYAAHPWHGHYRHTQYSQPLALVIPPTASRQTAWSWGVGNTTVTPTYHQFGRAYPGAGPQPTGGPYWHPRQRFAPTPRWPSHTDQFGVYYVRGPW